MRSKSDGAENTTTAACQVSSQRMILPIDPLLLRVRRGLLCPLLTRSIDKGGRVVAVECEVRDDLDHFLLSYAVVARSDQVRP